jgi:ADP-ribosylglycohydrolase
MTTVAERAEGALVGLAIGDAMGFPALVHTQWQLPEKRQKFIWSTNQRAAEQRITRIAVPFAHRLSEDLVAIGPSDDTEMALLTARILLECESSVTSKAFADGWRRWMLSDDVRTGFAERAAIDNLRRGLEPPGTGSDNPQHYEDGACARAVSIGIAHAGKPETAAEVARLDAEVSHAEDGVWAARAMATAIAVLVGGASMQEALAAGRATFPSESWIAYMDQRAQTCLGSANGPADLVLLLSQQVIDGIYSYASIAPQTLPAAFALAGCAADPMQAMTAANTIARAADSLPALVGALTGAHSGVGSLPTGWRACVAEARGVCLPFTAATNLALTAKRLLELAHM